MRKPEHIQLRILLTDSEADSHAIAREVISDALMAHGAIGIQETASAIIAYFEKSTYPHGIERIIAPFPHLRAEPPEPIPPQNWNLEWEQSLQPILVRAGEISIQVRPPSYPEDPSAHLSLVIQPRMAFGSGQHETTAMLLERIITLDPRAKNCLDVGCGSGILAIAAARLGAAYTEACDIDPWAYQSAAQNASANHAPIHLNHGGLETISPRSFDLILANLTANIIHDNMPTLAARLAARGSIEISGFYPADIPRIEQAARAANLQIHHQQTRGQWAACALQRANDAP